MSKKDRRIFLKIMKKLIITIAIIVIAIIGLSFLIKGNSPVGSIGADVVLGKTNTYTAFTASSTASRARVVDTGRIGLEIQNIGSNNVYVFLQATSILLSYQQHHPEF